MIFFSFVLPFFSYFCYLQLTLITFFETSKDAIKSVLYLRYLLFLIIIKQLIFKNDIKINYFLNLC